MTALRIWSITAVMVLLATLAGVTVSHPERSYPAPATEDEPVVYRVIGEWEGKVAVFLPQTHIPETVYDTSVLTLPAEEQERLRNGIAVTSREMLKKRLEDYLS